MFESLYWKWYDRGGALSFIEEKKEAVGVPIDLKISSTSSNINLQDGIYYRWNKMI